MAFTFSRSKTEDLARATNPHTVPADLVALAMHKSDDVRAAVAGRQDCPMATMLVLAQDKDSGVLDALVQNPGASLTVLQMLADSRRGSVRAAARRRLGVDL